MTTFIVRLTTDEAGRVSGIVERVRTGEKERFYGLDAIGALLGRMTRPDDLTSSDSVVSGPQEG